MQSLGLRASRAGRVAGGSIFLLAMASTGASAQSVFSGILERPPVFGPSATTTPGAETPAPLIDTRDFSIAPLVGLQETVTDNALLTPTDKKFDLITRPMLGAEVNVHGPFTASLIGHAYYDAYASQTQLSGFSGDAMGTATYTMVPDFLSIDANAMLMNGSISTFGTPVISRVGPANQITIATYDIGPHLTTTLDDFADLDVVGRFAQVYFDNPNASRVTLPNDSTLLAGGAAIDTKDRYQLVTNAQVEQDNHDFEGYNFQQTIFVRLFPEVRLIGRGGYDYVVQPGIVDIRETMWSGGAEYIFDVNPDGQNSTVSAEYGERFGHSAWRGELHLQLGQQLFAEGHYFESIQPNQLQINTAFNNSALAAVQLPPILGTAQFQINGNIDNETSLNKQGDLALVYTWETQSLGLRALWNDRMLLPSNNHDRTLVSSIEYERRIAPDLAAAATVDYYRTFANPFFGPSESLGGKIGVLYDINSTMRAAAGYAYQRQEQLFTNGETVTENVLYAAISKRF
jgi:uncharacterized protein (PEP-CTERM system associated)